MKSSKRDKAEGALYKVGSRVLDAIGSLTDDIKASQGMLGQAQRYRGFAQKVGGEHHLR